LAHPPSALPVLPPLLEPPELVPLDPELELAAVEIPELLPPVEPVVLGAPEEETLELTLPLLDAPVFEEGHPAAPKSAAPARETRSILTS
jgi:hypothetical protein